MDLGNPDYSSSGMQEPVFGFGLRCEHLTNQETQLQVRPTRSVRPDWQFPLKNVGAGSTAAVRGISGAASDTRCTGTLGSPYRLAYAAAPDHLDRGRRRWQMATGPAARLSSHSPDQRDR